MNESLVYFGTGMMATNLLIQLVTYLEHYNPEFLIFNLIGIVFFIVIGIVTDEEELRK